MTDHLTRLAARALRLAETVRPRQILLEPQSVVTERVRQPEPDIEHRPPMDDARPPESAETVLQKQNRGEPAPRPQPAGGAGDEPGHVATARVEPPPDRPPPVWSEPTAGLPQQARRPEHGLARSEPVPDAKPPAEPQVERVTRVLATHLPVRSTQTVLRSPPERGHDHAPTVRVTIGRVDVRAVAPEQPVERRPTRPPRMSLEEYLSRDRGGGR
jgi:hypothetical protein